MMFNRQLSPIYRISKAVENAIRRGKPVVALESTIITHGMPFPQNVETALELEEIVRQNGCVPATIALIDGYVKVGLSREELEFLGKTGLSALKTSRRDMALAIARKETGATTVSSTMIAAHKAGIKLFVTGGIGGVHRGAEQSFDVSADLTELGRTPITVVCAGVKSILDIGKTLEYLETQGVCVVTHGETNDFPAFYTRKSGFKSIANLPTIEECSKLIRANIDLGLESGTVIAVPIPKKDEYPNPKELERVIEEAVFESKKQGITGKESTPFLLNRIKNVTKGHSLLASIFLF